MSARSAIVRVGLGVLLLTAAGLKLYGLSVSAVPRVGWFAQPWVQLLATEWELVLGAWLVSGAAPRASWLAALGTFAAFAGVSGYLGWVGVASCGCLGTIKANPWWAFGVDVVALALLLASRPRFATADGESGWRGGLAWAGGVALVLAGLTGAGAWFYGSPSTALSRLRGEPLAVSTSYVDLGAGVEGDTRESSVRVWNWSERPVRLIGGTSDCSCVTTSDLPLTIPPGESRVVSVRLTIPRAALGRLPELRNCEPITTGTRRSACGSGAVWWSERPEGPGAFVPCTEGDAMTRAYTVLVKGLWGLAVVLMVLGMLAMPAQVALADPVPTPGDDVEPVDVVLCGLCIVNCTRDALGCTGACNSGIFPPRPCNILCTCMPSGATGCACTL